jgi:dTDP-4-amino-4,6-dideoxygalactose transaminase
MGACHAATGEKLAVNGGKPVRIGPMPPRRMFGEEEKAAAVALFDQAIESGNAFGYNGAEEQAFEKEFAAGMGGGFADGVNSGTTAVFVALGALQLEPCCEVIVSPITDPGGVMPIVMLNCLPVPVDAKPGTFNMSADAFEAAITPRTKAVVVAHIAGEPAEVDRIVTIAKKHDIRVVEDCAQAHGARLHGKLVGTFGDIAAFSTMSGKHLATAAQGGAVFTQNEDIFWKAKRFADRGKPFNLEGHTNCVPALNLNLNDLAATVGRVQLRKLPGVIAARRKVAAGIREGIADIPALALGEILPDAEPSYWFLRVHLDLEQLTVSKDDFANAVFAEGILGAASYRHIPTEFEWFKNNAACPTPYFYKGKVDTSRVMADAIATTEREFTLACYESWGEREIADIVAALRKVAAVYVK